MPRKQKSDKSLIGLKSTRTSGAGKVLDVSTLERIERRYQVTSLRRDGYTLRQIAESLNISEATVHYDLVDCLNETIQKYSETTEQSRQLQIERLDQLIQVYTPLATTITRKEVIDGRSGKSVVCIEPPNPIYASLILNIEARRAKLLALDVPEVKKLELTGIREYVGINVEDV